MSQRSNSPGVLIPFMQVMAIVFVVLCVSYVGTKQLEHSMKSLPTCFPPYFLMKAERPYGPTTRVTACDDGLRNRTGSLPVKPRQYSTQIGGE